MKESDDHPIARYMRRFFSGTLLSRVSGMCRDIGMAMAFGDHPSVAAFMVAFRFSHLLRRLLGEGSLQSILVPYYQTERLKGDHAGAVLFVRMTWLFVVCLSVLILFVEGVLSIKSLFIGHGEVVSLFAWLFPGLLFIGLYGLNLAILQCHGAFFAGSIAPAACNLIWIIAALWLAKYDTSSAMQTLAFCVVWGFALQWVMTIPRTWSLFRQGLQARQGSWFPQELKKMGKASLWSLWGVAAVQLNSFLDMLFARIANPKGPVYLWYAIRLEQLPLAVVGFACVYSITPTLTKWIVGNQEEEAKELFLVGYKRVLLFMIPCTFALFALGFSSVQVLFGRGHFVWEATIETTWCLFAYALSLLPSTLVVYQSSLFYAYGNVKKPMIASLLSVIVNLACNGVFVFGLHLGAVSVALSTSLCAFGNYWILKRWFMQSSLLSLRYPALRECFPILGASLFALLVSWGMDQLFLGGVFFTDTLAPRELSLGHQLLYFTCQLLSFLIALFIGLGLLSRKMLLEVKDLLFAKEPS